MTCPYTHAEYIAIYGSCSTCAPKHLCELFLACNNYVVSIARFIRDPLALRVRLELNGDLGGAEQASLRTWLRHGAMLMLYEGPNE